MDTTRIRPIAICLFRNNGRILVSEGFDTVKQAHYYRPLGGGIDYGETSEAAILREIEEELDAEVVNLKLVDVMENIFNYEGEQGHEIVFIFDGEFSDRSLYELDEIDAFEQEIFKAKWRSLDDINKTGGRLVPDGLASLLNGDRLSPFG